MGVIVNTQLGFFNVLVDLESKQILGTNILSRDGGEIMAVLQMAMVGGVFPMTRSKICLWLTPGWQKASIT